MRPRQDHSKEQSAYDMNTTVTVTYDLANTISSRKSNFKKLQKVGREKVTISWDLLPQEAHQMRPEDLRRSRG